jgi:hypothetical protein
MKYNSGTRLVVGSGLRFVTINFDPSSPKLAEEFAELLDGLDQDWHWQWISSKRAAMPSSASVTVKYTGGCKSRIFEELRILLSPL